MARTIYSLAALAVFLLLAWGAYRGWRNRATRQSTFTGEFPGVPGGIGEALLGPTTGLYVGSTIAGDWQDRVTVGDIGYRASGALTLYREGVLLARDGATSIWLPRAAVRAIRTDQKLAGKVTPKGGLLVLRWSVGETVIDTGFRGDGRDTYPQWLETVGAWLPDEKTETDDGRTQQ